MYALYGYNSMHYISSCTSVEVDCKVAIGNTMLNFRTRGFTIFP